MMTALVSDCRHAVRLYARTPGATLIAVFILAVGMACVGAFLSLYADLALKPFPGIADSERLVTIAEVDGENVFRPRFGMTERIAEEVTALEAVVGVGETPVGHEAEILQLEYVSRGFFAHIRPKLAFGRGFELAEHDIDAEPVVVISDRYWRERYEGNHDVLGETIMLTSLEPNEEEPVPTEFRIIGVMTPEMRGIVNDEIDIWVPFERILPFFMGSETDYAQLRSDETMLALGRLKHGISPEALVRELEARFQGEGSRGGPDTRFDAERGIVRDIHVHRDAERQLALFLAGSVLLALVAAANVSLFLLARAPGRRRELAIRLSVGAPKKRLARQLVCESGLLVVASCILGLLFSIWLASFLRGMAFLRSADWGHVTLLDWRVLSLVGGFLCILTFLVSLAPVLGLQRFGIAASSRQVMARATLAQRIAGTAQIMIAGAFGGSAIAFVWFLVPMVFGDPGYEIKNRHVAVFIPTSTINPTSGLDADRQRKIIEALPSVDLVTFTFSIPGGQRGGLVKRQVLDPIDSSRKIPVGYVPIDTQFVDVLGLRLLYGQTPTESEIGASLVNRTLARLVFGRDSVVGEILEFGDAPGAPTQIVGVLEDLSFGHPAGEVEPALFMRQRPPVFRSVIQSSLPSGQLQRELQRLHESGALELQPNSVMPLAEFRSRDIAPDKARGLLTITTASLVVLMAAFGFYGTQRYLVNVGRREYAIRAAIGAGPKVIGHLVFSRALILSLPGLVLGGLLAFIVVTWLRDEYLSRDISSGLVTVGVLFALTLLLLAASLGPARQAMRAQPAPLLRED